MQNYDIVLHQGDDSDFNGQQNYWILPEGDYEGYSARYSVGAIAKDAEIQSGIDENGETYKYVELILTAEDTAALPPDVYFAALKIFDARGKCATIDTRAVVKILPKQVPNGEE